MKFLEDANTSWDVIILDLPDPSDVALAKLYSQEFYRLATRRLAVDGAMSIQSTSPFRSREAFWCVVETMASVTTPDGAHLEVAPYHSVVPTFGTWGFTLAARKLQMSPAALGSMSPMPSTSLRMYCLRCSSFLPTCSVWT